MWTSQKRKPTTSYNHELPANRSCTSAPEAHPNFGVYETGFGHPFLATIFFTLEPTRTSRTVLLLTAQCFVAFNWAALSSKSCHIPYVVSCYIRSWWYVVRFLAVVFRDVLFSILFGDGWTTQQRKPTQMLQWLANLPIFWFDSCPLVIHSTLWLETWINI